MNLEQKQEVLRKWKESGLSLPKWWKENVDELDLPHLSTLYAWAKQLGFSTEPGAEVTNEHNEDHEEQGEKGDSDASQEESNEGPQDGSQGSSEREIDEEPEEEKEDVIAKERIEQLAPVTVPEPVHAEAPVEEPKTTINTQTLVVIGGAAILGIGAFLLIRKIRRRPEPKQEQNTQNAQGGNPFGYITIDEF